MSARWDGRTCHPALWSRPRPENSKHPHVKPRPISSTRRSGWSGAGAILPISGRASGSGQVIEASLLDAGETATELELLRAVASGLGVVWGQDELGAWAVVPNEPRSAFATAPEPPTALPHALYREDDNGARFLIARYATQAEAEAKAAELARGGHKQAYFVAQEDR